MFFIAHGISLFLLCATLACGFIISGHEKVGHDPFPDSFKEKSLLSACECPDTYECVIEEGYTKCVCPTGKSQLHKNGIATCWANCNSDIDCSYNEKCLKHPQGFQMVCIACDCLDTFECFINNNGLSDCRCPTGKKEFDKLGVPTCRSAPCAEAPCKHGGFCYEDWTRQSFLCECNAPWGGETCEINYACHATPCENGGQCTTHPEPPGFRCTCSYGWSGDTCEENLIDTTQTDSISDTSDDYLWTTESSEVFNETTDNYRWTSNDTSEFPDIDNETAVTDNKPSDFTVDFNVTYTPTNFTDDFNVSIDEIKNFTESNNLTTVKPAFEICEEDDDCLNGGVCQRFIDQYYCQCKPNFSGRWCQINVLCKKLESTCRAIEATCKIVGSNAVCVCSQEKMYNPSLGLCESICNPWRCSHGICQITGETYTCHCDSGYTGRNCNEKIKVVTNQNPKWFIAIVALLILTCLFLTVAICLYCRNRN